MKIETQPRDDHQVTLTVELDAEKMEGAKRRAARKISERKSIPGFRPGKAPYEVVLRSFGEETISEEAVDLLLDEIYPKALEESKIEPAAAGSLEKVENLDKKPRFTFTVPLAPKVELGDYRSIRLPYDWKEPGKEKTAEALEELRRMYAKTETVNRPVEIGDFVLIDLKGVNTKSEAGAAPEIDRPGMPVFIQTKDNSEEFPFQGFSKELIGSNLDETKNLTHKFEKDYKDGALQGKTISFEVKVKMIRGSILPDLNDEFAKQVGPFENLAALQDAVKANLASRSKSDYDDEYFAKVIEQIKGKSDIKYPPQVLDHEVEHVMEDLKSRLAQQGMDMTAYLKTRDMDEEKFLSEEAKPIAVKRLERSLLMDEISKAEKIEVSREALQSSFEETWGEYQNDSGFQKLMRGKNQPPKQLMNTVAMQSANRAYIQQTLNRLQEIASGNAPDLPAADGKSSTAAVKTSAKKKVGSQKRDTSKQIEGKKAASKSTRSTTKKSTSPDDIR